MVSWYDVERPLTLNRHDAGKEIALKSDAPKCLNVMEEAKVAGRVKRAAASAIAAASVKAKLLADQEEREMKRLMEDVIEKQVTHFCTYGHFQHTCHS